MSTTTDLSDFGSSERWELENLLRAWREQGLPLDFYEDKVIPMMNKNSGNVFLTNDEFQVAMRNGEKLESFYTCSNCGNEGFLEDCQLTDDGYCNQCNDREQELGKRNE